MSGNFLFKLSKALKSRGYNKFASEVLRLGGGTYTVKPGDSLWDLVGGDYRFLEEIKKENPNINWDALQIGQKIKIPEPPSRGNSNMQYSESLVSFVKRHEGLRLTPYIDPNGYLTVGYGHNLGKGESSSRRISESVAEQLLRKDLDHAADYIRKNIDTPLSQHQFDALVSIIFNVGRAAFDSSKLGHIIKSGQLSLATEHIKGFNTGNLKGLIKRRKEEASMFEAGTY